MTEKELREKVRQAIEKDGIGVVAKRTGVLPPTIHRFVANTARTHRGTIKLIEDAFRNGGKRK